MKQILQRNVLKLFFISVGILASFKVSSQVNVNMGNSLQMKSAEPSGGNFTNINSYNILTFLSSGTLTVPKGYSSTNVELLIVAGGGGGGFRNGGGGGAGGLIDKINYTLNKTQSIIIGYGGVGSQKDTGINAYGQAGSNSSIDGFVAEGGGGGGSNGNLGQPGGSGGGGSNGFAGGQGTQNQGNSGGDELTINCYNGAGGGGSGFAATSPGNCNNTNGGDGVLSSVSGTSIYYAGGGAGGSLTFDAKNGGNGGGGYSGGNCGSAGGDGIGNSGGGGGGGGSYYNGQYSSGSGGTGGSGIVIVKYPCTQGVWTCDNIAVATIDPKTGIVSGVTKGTANIIYTVTTASSTSTYTQVLTVTTPLPITLVYFEASYKNCTANLIWKSASEINSSYYAIEYSQDGSSFSQVAKLDAANKINGAAYTKSFSNVPTGKAYYRLKMVDTDGKFTFSNIIAITTNDICNARIALSVRPNPSTDNVIVDGLKNGNHLTLINSEGIKLKSFIANGISQKINLRQYPGGIYLINVVSADGGVKTLQVVKK